MSEETAQLQPTGKMVLDPMSRFRGLAIYQDPASGIDFYETYVIHTFPQAVTDIYHIITPGEAGRLDLIAYRYYGSPALWWVLAEANGLAFPMVDACSGLVLRVPAYQGVLGGF